MRRGTRREARRACLRYARHFRISCRRLLGLGENVGGRSLTGGVLSIDIGSRIVKITVSHIGLERDVICHRLSQPEVKVEEEKLRKHTEGRTVIGGLEKLNNLQGVLIKLLAHEQLLQNYPMWRSRLTLLQVCIPDAERPVESKALSEEVRVQRFGHACRRPRHRLALYPYPRTTPIPGA